MKPQARTSGLVVRELADEVVVYDLLRHQAHCLNRTAATVFRNADGRRSVSDLAALLDPEGPAGASEAVVSLAIERLAEAHLLDGEPTSAPGSAFSRREAMRRVGLGAAVLLPVVASVLAPTPAEAAATCVTSCATKPDGTPCHCFGENPCTATCVANACSAGGC